MNTSTKSNAGEGGPIVAEKPDRRELLKDIIGRPKWWLTVAPLIVLVLIVASILSPDKSDGAVPADRAPALSSNSDKAPAAMVNCVRGVYECYPTEWFVEEFKDGKYGNAHGLRFPSRLKQMLNTALQAKAAQGDRAAQHLLLRQRLLLGSDPNWWEEVLGFSTCIAGPQFTGTCRRSQERINEFAADTSHVTLWCSISTFVGSLRGGGWWGAGKGAALCFWHQFMPKWW